MKRFSQLRRFIPTGKCNAISMLDLCDKLQTNPRVLKAVILDARKKGLLILSDDVGYYFAADDSELNDYVRRRTAYIKTASIALAPFKRALKGA